MQNNNNFLIIIISKNKIKTKKMCKINIIQIMKFKIYSNNKNKK